MDFSKLAGKSMNATQSMTVVRIAIMLAIAISGSAAVVAQQVDDRATLERELRRMFAGDALAAPPSPYWIGVRCGDDKDQPLNVAEVIQGAPADKAGVRVGDEIVAVGGEKVTSVSGLVEAVQGSKGEQMTLTVRRGGKELPIQLTPHRRRLVDLTLPPGRGTKNLTEWIQQQATSGLEPGINMRLINPGIVFESRQVSFPAETSITLQRKGDHALTIVVKRGEDQWDVTHDSLHELPEDLRHWARLLLNLSSSSPSIRSQLPPDIHLLLPTPAESLRQDAAKDQQRANSTDMDDLRQRIDELSRQVESLRKSIDRSRKSEPAK